MATTYRETVYSAIVAAVEAYFAGLGIPVLYPGTFTKTSDTTQWVVFRFFMTDIQNYALENDGPAYERGFFRLGIASNPAGGELPLIRIADGAASEFNKGTIIDAASNTRISEEPSMGGTIEESDKIMIPLTVRFTGSILQA